MNLMLRLARILARPPRTIGQLGSWVILPLIAVIMFDVITRKIDYVRVWMAELNLAWFNPIIFQDSEWHLHAILVLLSIGYGYTMNSHVRVDILRERLSRRGQAKVELIGLLVLGIPFLMLITYFAGEFVAFSISQNEGSESLTGIPRRYLIKSFLVIGFVLILCAFIATALRLVVVLFGDEAARKIADGELQIFAHWDIEAAAETPESDVAGRKDQS